jgi:hypothetical protein
MRKRMERKTRVKKLLECTRRQQLWDDSRNEKDQFHGKIRTANTTLIMGCVERRRWLRWGVEDGGGGDWLW